jgi:hypothetical protein
MRKFGFMNVARLAAIVIAFARLAFLVIPIPPVSAKFAAFPVVMSRAIFILRFPFCGTSAIAKVILVHSYPVGRSAKHIVARGAGDFYRGIERIISTFWVMLALPFVATGAVTEMVFRLGDPMSLSLKRCAAIVARCFDSVSLHKRNLLLMLTGSLSKAHGHQQERLNHIKFSPAGQTNCAFDHFIIHELGVIS